MPTAELRSDRSLELAEVALSPHACDRYRERVRPTLARAAAKRDLERLIAAEGRIVPEPPAWLAERQRVEDADAYVLVGDDLVLPVRVCGRFASAVAVTCLSRTGISELARQRRNRRRREMGARRRARRTGGTRPRRRR
jgi:hypothetical protein